MNQKNYNIIAEIIKGKSKLPLPRDVRYMVNDLADYFEEEEIISITELQGKFPYCKDIKGSFNRKQFLLDCGVE